MASTRNSKENIHNRRTSRNSKETSTIENKQGIHNRRTRNKQGIHNRRTSKESTIGEQARNPRHQQGAERAQRSGSALRFI
jgi:hypothetical protein